MSISPPNSTLEAIQIKVRRLTRSMSEAQLTDDDLNNYINTFVVYDFPEHLRLFNLRTVFKFWCNPYQSTYPTDIAGYGGASDAPDNALYDFDNKYLTIHGPVYIAGYQSYFSQSREQFYGIYPLVNSIASIGPTGDGSSTTFNGYVNSQQAILPPLTQYSQQVTLIRENVLFSSVDIYNNGLALIDVPILDSATGNPTIYGNLYTPGTEPSTPLLATAPYTPVPNGIPNSNNYINYLTGQFYITFPTPPANAATINSQTVPQITSLPQALLYYDGQITLRPTPDQPYQISFEAYVSPTYLMAEDQSPQLNEWWQYIAYGAAKKIFEDRMDMESVQLILPEYKKQEALVLRRTIVQYTNDRVATIYTEQTHFGTNFGWGWGGGGGQF